MPKISCSVASCSYNESGICDARELKIVGNNASITEGTSCSTYTHKENVSNSVGDGVTRGETETIHCDVETCAYNQKHHCALRSGIEVGNLGNVDSYNDTDCLSFEYRSY